MLFLRGLAWLFIGLLLTPRSRTEVPEPPTFDDVQVPKSREGTPFGREYGTVWVDDMQVHWFGDYALRPIRVTQSKK